MDVMSSGKVILSYCAKDSGHTGMIVCSATDHSVTFNSSLNMPLALFLTHAIITASSVLCKISVAVLHINQFHFEKKTVRYKNYAYL